MRRGATKKFKYLLLCAEGPQKFNICYYVQRATKILFICDYVQRGHKNLFVCDYVQRATKI